MVLLLKKEYLSNRNPVYLSIIHAFTRFLRKTWSEGPLSVYLFKCESLSEPILRSILRDYPASFQQHS